MTRTCDQSFEAQIKLLFSRGLSPESDAKVRTHVAACDRCARLYERYAEAERALHQQDLNSALNPSMQARIEGRLFEAEAPKQGHALPRIAVALAAVSALAVATFSAVVPPTPDAMQPRGVHVPPPRTGLVMRALRVRRIDGQPQVQELGHGVQDLVPGDEVALMYVNIDGALTAQVILRSLEGSQRVLLSRTAIKRTYKDERLGPVITVSEDWPQGPATLVGHFDGPDGPMQRKVYVNRVER